MAQRVQEIIVNLKDINEEANRLGLQFQVAVADHVAGSVARETDSMNMDSKVIGRDGDASEILKMLMPPSDKIISVIPITGMGGIGKTTLARKVFNDEQLKENFDKRIWVCVSENFDVTRLLDQMLESLTGKKAEADSREAKVKKLQGQLENNRYLLVLDDVWNDKSALWNDFLGSLKGMSTAKGNFILLTTRSTDVASMMATFPPFPLSQLSEDDCWLILKEKAFDSGEVLEELQVIGREIAQKCQGLPLLAKILGGMLYNKGRVEWISVLQNMLQYLSKDENYVMRILKVSFDRLPSPAAKCCFTYCSIFPKDYYIERKQLIQLWMAEGFLETKPESNMEMEEMGNKIFSVLLQSSLLQDVENDNYGGNVFRCKMHDLVRDLAQSISGSRTTNMKHFEGNFDQVRYLALGRTQHLPNQKAKNVRTLFLEDNLSDDMVSAFTSLRALTLCSLDVEELPNSIGKLSHLRYLDLSKTRIEALPDSICKLYYLQTFRAKQCHSLTKFPDNFKNLIHLRHFDYYTNDSSSTLMPIQMGCLTSLRTYPFFNIGDEKGRQIEELKGLKNLSGSLVIRNLELVNNGKNGADSASLSSKANMRKLVFQWGNNWEGNSTDNEVLEGLQPHQNLKALAIQNFMGDQLSSWFATLDNLVNLKLKNCRKCIEVPQLGHLSFLESLEFDGLHEVRSISSPFYGLHNSGGSSSQNRGGQVERRLFPKLERLILRNMPNLVKWMEVEGTTTARGTVVVFPSLEQLIIENCPKLSTAPSHFPSLKNLKIELVNHGLQMITMICSKVTTLISLRINNVQELDKLPDCLLHNPKLATIYLANCLDLELIVPERFLSLEMLDIEKCPNLQSIPITSESLRELRIRECNGLTHLMLDSSSMSLNSLSIFGCDNLISFPMDFHQLQLRNSLTFLALSQCPKLKSIPKGLGSLTRLWYLSIGPFSDTIEELESFFNDLQELSWTLECLDLYGRPHWEFLPQQLQHLSALKSFSLNDFGVNALPDWVGNLSSLEKLELSGFEKLHSLPSVEAMRRLTYLRNLQIENCPLLKKRCNQHSGSNSEWSKISNIPEVYIDWIRIEG